MTLIEASSWTVAGHDNLLGADSVTAVEETEALMIRAFGLRRQNQMRFKSS